MSTLLLLIFATIGGLVGYFFGWCGTIGMVVGIVLTVYMFVLAKPKQ